MERDRSRSISPGGEPDQKPDESSREEKNKKPEGEKKVVSDKAQEKARQQKEEEEKKKAEAEEKAAEEKAREELDEEEKREEEKEETEERDRKLTHLRQQILGVAAVGILTQSLQRLWRLLRWRRQLEIADDGRILTADGHVDLGRLAYAAQAEAEQSDAAATPGDQANQTDRSDEILAPAGVLPETVEQIADVQIPADPLADQAINSDDLRSQEDGEDSTGDETYTDEDFSGDLPDWAFDNLPNPEESPPENPLELDDVQPKRSKPAKEKASKPWNLFGDRDNSLRSPDQTKPPDKKPLDVQQKTKDESSSPNAEQPQKISESDAKKMTEKLLGKLNSEEAKILRESSGPSREFMAHLIREKLGVKVDLKGSDLDKIGRSLRQKLREPVDQISAPTSTSDGGPIGGDGVTPGSATPSGSGSGTGAASSTSSQVAGAPSGLGATAYSSDGSDFGSDEPFPLGGSNIQSNNVPGESAGVRRSRSGDGKEVDWSSLPPDDFGGGSPAISGSNRASSIGSPLSSSPSYSPEFGKPGSSSQRTSSPPGQGTSSSLAGSSVAGPAVSSAANRNPVTGGSSPSFSGFGPTSSNSRTSRSGSSSSGVGPRASSATGANADRSESVTRSTGYSSYPAPDISGLASLFGGFGLWAGRGLSRSGRRRADNLSGQIGPQLSPARPERSTVPQPSTKAEQRAVARDVGLLNALRELYLLAVAAGAMLPNETLIDVRQVNETRDVHDDATQNQTSQVMPIADDSSLDEAEYLATLIILASLRDAENHGKITA